MVTLIEDEKIIAGEKIIDLLQVINFLYSWSVKDKKKYIQNYVLFFNFTVIFQPFCIRPKIRPKNGFFCYVPFLGLIFWVTFCSNSNTLTFDSKVYIWSKSLVKKLL